MATRYVSNVASNGYGLGNDSTGNGTQATPYLTINKAVTVSSNGDTINVNGTSSTKLSANHPYVENSGSGFLQIAISVVVQRDPSQTDSTGFVVIQPVANTTRVMSCGLDSGVTGQTFSDLWFDNLVGSSGITALTPHASSLSLTLIRCGGLNISSSGAFIGSTSGTNPVTLDRCILDSTNLGGFISWQSGNLIIKGGTYTGMTGGQKIVVAGSTGVTQGSFTLQADINGGVAAFGGNGIPYYQTGGVVTGFAASGFSFTNCQRGFNFAGGSDAAMAITGSWTMNNFTVTYGSNSTLTFFTGTTENFVAPTIHDFTITEPRTDGTSVACFDLLSCTGSPLIYNGTINNSGQTYCLKVGSDGPSNNTNNSTAGTGFQNLGDVSGNAYVDQFFTTQSYAQTAFSYLGYIMFSLKKTGSPTGTISCSLYADNSGNPGSLIETAANTLAATALTTSVQTIEFDFQSRTHITPGTKVHVVLSYSGGTGINGTDYVLIAENTTTTAGSVLKSSDNASWSADSSHALLFVCATGAWAIIDPVVRNCVINGNNYNVQQHGLILGCTTRGQMYRNQHFNTTITNIFKFNKASSGNRAVAWGNLVVTGTTYSNSYLFAQKAGQYADYVNNTFVTTGACTAAAVFIPDNQGNFGLTVANGMVADNIRVMNNIFVNASTTGTTPTYNAIANPIGQYATNITIDYNDVYTTHGNPIGIVNGTTYSSWATWKAVNLASHLVSPDAHSINTDPLLANESNPTTYTDFIPALNSPVKGVGINMNGTVPTDYVGNNYSLAPDIGAFSLSPYYLVTQINKIVLNPFTGQFDYAGLTKAVADLLYAPTATQYTTTTSLAIPPSKGKTVIFADATSASITITLPDSTLCAGGSFKVIKKDSTGNTVTLATAGGQTIDGSATKVLSSQYNSFTADSDGANYYG